MHTALLTNTAWIDDELQLFRQLVVGLMDELVRVAQVLPHHLPLDEASDFGEKMQWRESGWRWLYGKQFDKLVPELRSAEVDIIHALDGRMWTHALSVGEQLDCPVVLSVNSDQDLALVRRLGKRMVPSRVALMPTSEMLYDAVMDALPANQRHDQLVRCVPLGAMAVDHLEVLDEKTGSEDGLSMEGGDDETDIESELVNAGQPALCLVVTGSGRHDEDYQHLLEGLAQVLEGRPDVQCFFDGQLPDQSRIWQAARELNLVNHISLIPRRVGHREILLGASVLIQPQSLGKSRSITLQAMGRGIPVVAAEDPWVDYLVDEETAWVMQRQGGKIPAKDWAVMLDRLMNDAASSWALGRRAHAWVKENRKVSGYIAGVLDVYHRISGTTLKFQQAG